MKSTFHSSEVDCIWKKKKTRKRSKKDKTRQGSMRRQGRRGSRRADVESQPYIYRKERRKEENPSFSIVSIFLNNTFR